MCLLTLTDIFNAKSNDCSIDSAFTMQYKSDILIIDDSVLDKSIIFMDCVIQELYGRLGMSVCQQTMVIAVLTYTYVNLSAEDLRKSYFVGSV